MPAVKPAAEIKKDTNTILISPLDPNLIIDETKNLTRQGDPWTEETIAKMAQSLSKHGQQQDCGGYLDDDGKIHLMFGFGRALGAKHLAKTELPEFKLRIRLQKNLSEDTIADNNVVENYHRRKNNDADAAIGMKQRLDAGYTKEQVAELYQCSVQWVERTISLNKLPKRHMDAMRQGVLLPSVAIDVLRWKNTEERNKVLDKIVSAAKKGEKITARMARKMIQDHVADMEKNGQDTGKEEQATDTSESNGKATEETKPTKTKDKEPDTPAPAQRKKGPNIPNYAKTIPDVRDFFVNLESSPVYPKTVKDFGAQFMLWLSGKLGKDGDELLEKSLEKVYLDNPKGQKNENDEDVSKGWTEP